VTKRLIDLDDDLLAEAQRELHTRACPTPSAKPCARPLPRPPGPDSWRGSSTAAWPSWPTRTSGPRSGAELVAIARFLIDTSAAARMRGELAGNG
jgi:hypothetical protein